MITIEDREYKKGDIYKVNNYGYAVDETDRNLFVICDMNFRHCGEIIEMAKDINEIENDLKDFENKCCTVDKYYKMINITKELINVIREQNNKIDSLEIKFNNIKG
jgi:hypothetical protein